MENVLVVGHSFIRRLETFGPPIILKNQDAIVNLCGHLRTTRLNLITDLIGHERWYVNTFGVPKVLVLCLGTNDICNYPFKSPEEIVDDLLRVLDHFLDMKVRRVLLVECLPRFGIPNLWDTPFRWREGANTLADAEIQFQQCVNRFNNQIKYKCQFKYQVNF